MLPLHADTDLILEVGVKDMEAGMFFFSFLPTMDFNGFDGLIHP